MDKFYIFKDYWGKFFNKLFVALPYKITHIKETWEFIWSSGVLSVVLVFAVIGGVIALFAVLWNTRAAGWRELETTRTSYFLFWETSRSTTSETVYIRPINSGFFIKAILAFFGFAPLVWEFSTLRNMYPLGIWGGIWRGLLYFVMRLLMCVVVFLLFDILGTIVITILSAAILTPFYWLHRRRKTAVRKSRAKRGVARFNRKKKKLHKIIDAKPESQRAKYNNKLSLIIRSEEEFLKNNEDVLNNYKEVLKEITFRTSFARIHGFIKNKVFVLLLIPSGLMILAIHFMPFLMYLI